MSDVFKAYPLPWYRTNENPDNPSVAYARADDSTKMLICGYGDGSEIMDAVLHCVNSYSDLYEALQKTIETAQAFAFRVTANCDEIARYDALRPVKTDIDFRANLLLEQIREATAALANGSPLSGGQK